MKVAKALGGSFKLVTLAPKTVREMTQLPRETEKDGDTQTNQRNTNEYIKYKPRLNTQKNTLGPTGSNLLPHYLAKWKWSTTQLWPGTVISVHNDVKTFNYSKYL